jgi:hypothetical protein
MTEAEYQAWWELHLRAAKRETLSAEESARYNAGLLELNGTEVIRPDYRTARRTREQLRAMQQEHDILHRRREELEKQIHQLEESLSAEERRFIGVD